MIATNSGKIYRFTMDHGLGYGFAEVYDFTDHPMFDGRLGDKNMFLQLINTYYPLEKTVGFLKQLPGR